MSRMSPIPLDMLRRLQNRHKPKVKPLSPRHGHRQRCVHFNRDQPGDLVHQGLRVVLPFGDLLGGEALFKAEENCI